MQKQIERLYGHQHKTTVTSNNEKGESGGGFFSKRFGLTKQKSETNGKSNGNNNHCETTGSGNGPLDFKPLKVPAVFRLLRPEFREQLKSHSCQIPGDRTSPSAKERIVPIQMEKDSEKPQQKPATSPVKPALPAKPTSPVNNESPKKIVPPKKPERSPEKVKNGNSDPTTEKSSPTPKSPDHTLFSSPKPYEKPAFNENQPTTPIKSPTENPPLSSSKLVANCMANRAEVNQVEEEEEEIDEDLVQEMIVYDDQDNEFVDTAPVERSLLTTILEEDNESTASAGSQVNLVKVQEVQDGHYFIKVRLIKTCF